MSHNADRSEIESRDNSRRSRRQFLREAALAGSALALAPCNLRAEPASARPVRPKVAAILTEFETVWQNNWSDDRFGVISDAFDPSVIQPAVRFHF